MDEFFQKGKKGVLFFLLLGASFIVKAQTNIAQDTLLQEVTLKNAIDYAIKFQPQIQQALIDEQITASNIRGKLADWYPQVNFNYNFQHNFILPSNIIGGNLVRFQRNSPSQEVRVGHAVCLRGGAG